MAVKEAGSSEFTAVYHQYGPHRAGLPNLVVYFREMWLRRAFASEMSKASMRSANTMTFFGQAWLILNPLLLAGVYFLLITILGHSVGGGSASPIEHFAHLTLALFVFTFFSTSVSTGSTSVTGSGKLLLNTAFPRLLIPMSAVRTAFFRWLPTVPVYVVFHLLAGLPWGLHMIGALFFLGCVVVFSMGLAAIFATLQVYFRDTSSFLPYILRLWMYMSPVLWFADQINTQSAGIKVIAQANPMFGMVRGYVDFIQETHPDVSPAVFLTSAAWAIGAAIVGFLYFISRERDFAVRVL